MRTARRRGKRARRAKSGCQGGAAQKSGAHGESFCRKKKGMDGTDGFFNYGRDNAAAAATALTIRHSRFAALTLAKLVASLALHPPVSATEADCAPHPSG